MCENNKKRMCTTRVVLQTLNRKNQKMFLKTRISNTYIYIFFLILSPPSTLPFSSFLHTLNHPNIVKLHGVTSGSVETAVAAGKECGYFIVVDRLYKT